MYNNLTSCTMSFNPCLLSYQPILSYPTRTTKSNIRRSSMRCSLQSIPIATSCLILISTLTPTVESGEESAESCEGVHENLILTTCTLLMKYGASSGKKPGSYYLSFRDVLVR